jgi:hypothetical protein
VTLVITNRLFFGFAVTSRSTNEAAVAEFRELLPVEDTSLRGVSPRDLEPLGPSSRRTGLVLSEIMYHPKERADGKVLEYVELFNTQPFAEDISQYRLEVPGLPLHYWNRLACGSICRGGTLPR